MSIFDNIRQSDDAFVDELEYNMKQETVSEARSSASRTTPSANSYPMLSRDTDGNIFEMPEYADVIANLREYFPDTAEASILEARNAALSAVEFSESTAGAKLGGADRRDYLENIERALLHAHMLSTTGVSYVPDTHFDVEGKGMKFSDMLERAWLTSSLSNENTENAPQASAALAQTDSTEEKVEEEQKQTPSDLNGETQSKEEEPEAEKASPARVDDPSEVVEVSGQELDANNGMEDDPQQNSGLVLSQAAYQVQLPKKDDGQLVDRNQLQETLRALSQEEANELREERSRFANMAVKAVLEKIDPDQTSEEDIQVLYKAMGSAYFGTQLARKLLGSDRSSDIRATIKGNTTLDAIFQETLNSRELAASVPNAEQTKSEMTAMKPSERITNSTAGERKQDELDSTNALNRSFVMNGDEESEPGPKKVLSIEEQMEAMGFPKRPKLWPAVMAWPMQPDFDLLVRGNPAQAQVDAYVKSMQEMQTRMLQRAEQINSYIHDNNPVDDRVMWLHRRQSRKHLKATVDDPHYGIRWASLLDDKSTRPSSAIVREWAHHRATTNDGGIVIAARDSIGFKKITNQAVALSIQEGVARGWGSFKMQGDHKFTAAAIEAAKQANVKAVITEMYGPWNLFKRKHTVMPTPPGVQNEMPRVETENVGVTPDDVNARKPLSEADLRNELAEEVTGKMTAEDKRRALEGIANLPSGDPAEQTPKLESAEVEDPFIVLDRPELSQTTQASTRVIQEGEDDIRWRDEGNPDAGRDLGRGPQMA
ncbi:hypothetical protein KUV57_12990 [Epibacterium sp. DP7N7-1]|nr:hypothetical protein [Epibacterium sp. DP7N7-1]